MPTISSSTLSPVVAGNAFSGTLTITGDFYTYGMIRPTSATFTRFRDSSSGATLDIPASRSNIIITSPTTNGNNTLTYTFAASGAAYDIDIMPPTISQVPRGSSDLVLPSPVIVSTDFLNSGAYQVFSYVPSSLASVTAEFTIVVYQFNLNVGTYTYTISQVVTRPAYLGYNDLMLGLWR